MSEGPRRREAVRRWLRRHWLVLFRATALGVVAFAVVWSLLT